MEREEFRKTKRMKRWRLYLVTCMITIFFALSASASLLYEDTWRQVESFASQAQANYRRAGTKLQKQFTPSAADKKIFQKTYKVALQQARAGRHVVVVMNSVKFPKGMKCEGLKVVPVNAGKAFASERKATAYSYQFQDYTLQNYLQFDATGLFYKGKYYAGFEVTKKRGAALKDLASGKAKKAVEKWAKAQIRKELSPYDFDAFEKLGLINCIVARKFTYSDKAEEDNILYLSLSRNRALCLVYSGLYMALCRAAGFETAYVDSEDHAWVGVKVKGRWLYIDPTWSDVGRTIGTDGRGGYYYVYYKCTFWDRDHQALFTMKAA